MTGSGEKFARFIDIVRELRAETGCPWDRAQSPVSLKHYLLEEVQELLEAIDEGDPAHVKEELGDLLYIIVLLAQIYSEEKSFTMAETIAAISNKMVRRHPHVFTDEKIGSAADLRQRWLEIKDSEKAKRRGSKKN